MQSAIMPGIMATQYAMCSNDRLFFAVCSLPTPVYCNLTQKCYDPVSQPCTTTYSPPACFDATPGTVLLAYTTEVCPVNNAHFPISNNCSIYYNCSTSSPVLMVCPAGTYYDCMLQSCEAQTYEFCCPGDVTAKSTSAVKLADAFTSMQCNCVDGMLFSFDNLYECSNNVIYYSTCVPFPFCNLSQSCYDPSVTQCKAEYTAQTPQIIPKQSCHPIAPPVDAVDICFSTFSSYADWKNCSKYYTCNETALVSNTCGQNLVWNGFKKCCVSPDEVFTSSCAEDRNGTLQNNRSCSFPRRREEHPARCDYYFQCSKENVIVVKKCPLYHQFDWQRKRCVDSIQANTVPYCRPDSYSRCVKASRWLNIIYLCEYFYYYLPFIGDYQNMYQTCVSVICSLLFFS